MLYSTWAALVSLPSAFYVSLPLTAHVARLPACDVHGAGRLLPFFCKATRLRRTLTTLLYGAIFTFFEVPVSPFMITGRYKLVFIYPILLHDNTVFCIAFTRCIASNRISDPW